MSEIAKVNQEILDSLWGKIQEAFTGIGDRVTIIGQVLHEAQQNHGGFIYNKLVNKIHHSFGLSRANIENCRTIAAKGLDPKVFFLGGSNRTSEKLLLLGESKPEAIDLLSSEASIPVISDQGESVEKPWSEFSLREQNRALSRDGKLLPPEEQEAPRHNKRHPRHYSSAKIDGSQLIINENDCPPVFITLKALAVALESHGQVNALMKVLSEHLKNG